MDNKFHWIREDITIDFELPKLVKDLIEEAEELDLARSEEYHCVADAIDVACKGFVVTGYLSEKQWDIVVEKYPCY